MSLFINNCNNIEPQPVSAKRKPVLFKNAMETTVSEQYNNKISPSLSNIKAYHQINQKVSFGKSTEKSSFHSGVLPEDSIKLNVPETLAKLEEIIGKEAVNNIMSGEQIDSPLKKVGEQNTDWLKKSKVVGINPRTVKTYFNIAKYAMTFPEDAVHILPFLNPGDLNCLYNPNNFNYSWEFLDKELSEHTFKDKAGKAVKFDTPEKQLKLCVNILHSLGKKVGFDVMHHTDRFSEVVLTNPEKFYWIKLNKNKSAQLYPKMTKYDELSTPEKQVINNYYKRNIFRSKSNLLFQQIKKNNLSLVSKELEASINANNKYNENPKSVQTVYSEIISAKNFNDLSSVNKKIVEDFYLTISMAPKDKDVRKFFAKKLAVLENYESLSKDVKASIKDYLQINGDASANNKPMTDKEIDSFFDGNEQERQKILFGNPPCENDSEAVRTQKEKIRFDRRVQVMNHIRKEGLETVPVGDNCQLRPIIFDKILCNDFANWAEFTKPYINNGCDYEIFGNMTPLKFYPMDDYGYLDTKKPEFKVWDYLAQKAANIQSDLNADFIRADMGHLQIAHSDRHSEKNVKNTQEFWPYIKSYVQKTNDSPYFAVWAESFLDSHKYVDPIKDTENKKFDVVFSNLHYQDMNRGFSEKLKERNFIGTDKFQAAVTACTHDSDNREFAHLYDSPIKNIARIFAGLFLNQPSYMINGFECKDAGSDYNHDFIMGQNKIFNWGRNKEAFHPINQIRVVYDKLKRIINKQNHWWINNNSEGVNSWLYYNAKTKLPSFLFVLNTDNEYSKKQVVINNPYNELDVQEKFKHNYGITPVLSTSLDKKMEHQIIYKNNPIKLTNLAPGEGRVYRIISKMHL